MDTVRERLRQALGAALKARDMIAVSALRSALGAIDNASAVPVSPAPVSGAGGPDGAGGSVGASGPHGAGSAYGASDPPGASSPHFAKAVAGLGAAETRRRDVSDDEAAAIVRGEIAERRAAAGVYERAGRADRAGRLSREADILESAVAVET